MSAFIASSASASSSTLAIVVFVAAASALRAVVASSSRPRFVPEITPRPPASSTRVSSTFVSRCSAARASPRRTYLFFAPLDDAAAWRAARSAFIRAISAARSIVVGASARRSVGPSARRDRTPWSASVCV